MAHFLIAASIILTIATSTLASADAETSEWNAMLRDFNADRDTEPYRHLPVELDASHPLWTADQAKQIRAAQECDRNADHLCTFEALHALYESNLHLMSRSCEINQPWDECGPYDVLGATYNTLSLQLAQSSDVQKSRRAAEMSIALFDRFGAQRGYTHGAVVYHLPRAEACIELRDMDCVVESAGAIEAAMAARAWWVPVQQGFPGAIFEFDMDDAVQRVEVINSSIQAISE